MPGSQSLDFICSLSVHEFRRAGQGENLPALSEIFFKQGQRFLIHVLEPRREDKKVIEAFSD